jgi:hypothetical protein
MANRWSDKEWRTALRLALLEKHEKHGTKLRAIAEVVVSAALDGKMDAIQEIGSRLDGRPAQDINVESRVTHELAGLSDAEVAERIARELAELAGRGEKATPTEKLH